MDSNSKKGFMPFSLTALIIILDQAAKAFIVANWPLQNTIIWPRLPGMKIEDIYNKAFLVFWHVRNKAIAFSLGTEIPQPYRVALFVIIPIVVLVFLTWYYFNTSEFNQIQRWAIAGIIGGGLSNIIDRIFRPDGVVDFISVKFYGLFGLSRWPTFNIADASVVICCIILLLTIMLAPRQRHTTNQRRFHNE